MNTFFLKLLRNPPTPIGKTIVPVRPYNGIGIPGVECDQCGQIWATSLDHISRDLPEGHYLWSRSQWPVPPSQLRTIVEDVRTVLNLPENQLLLPGTRVSVLRFRYLQNATVTLDWPIINTLIISEAVKHFWETHHFSGWYADPVLVTEGPDGAKPDALYEVSITGQGGTALTSPAVTVLSRCEGCGRVEYDLDYATLIPEHFHLNARAWDGTDLFRFDPPFNGRIVVSERFRIAMQSSPFGNFELPTIQSEMRRVVENQQMLAQTRKS